MGQEPLEFHKLQPDLADAMASRLLKMTPPGPGLPIDLWVAEYTYLLIQAARLPVSSAGIWMLFSLIATYKWDIATLPRWLAAERTLILDKDVNSRDAYVLESVICAKWAMEGYPTIRLGHKQAAALAVTAMAPELPETVHLPFSAFRLMLPDHVIPSPKGNGYVKHIGITEELRSNGAVHWHVYLTTTEPGKKTKLTAYAYTADRKDLMEGRGPHIEDDTQWAPNVANVLAIVGRLALGTALLLENEASLTPVGKHSIRTDRNYLPHPRQFRVIQDIKHDFREALTDYFAGRTGGKLSVKFVVRGHWRNQACGPQMKDHKRIWIQPHWKGPEDAPIALRTHIL